MLDIVCDVVRGVFKGERVPRSWLLTKVTVLYKNKGDKGCLDNYRGI